MSNRIYRRYRFTGTVLILYNINIDHELFVCVTSTPAHAHRNCSECAGSTRTCMHSLCAWGDTTIQKQRRASDQSESRERE